MDDNYHIGCIALILRIPLICKYVQRKLDTLIRLINDYLSTPLHMVNVRKAIWKLRQKYTNVGSATTSDFTSKIKRAIPQDAVTVIDVGCGMVHEGDSKDDDILSSCFSNPKYKITGIDGFEPNIQWRKANHPTGDFVQMDVRKIDELGKKFDVVICHHVIEHFEKDESIALVKKLESSANKLLVIGTPIGFVDTAYNVELHQNELEAHKCGWTPEEFKNLGYETFSKKNAFIAMKFFK